MVGRGVGSGCMLRYSRRKVSTPINVRIHQPGGLQHKNSSFVMKLTVGFLVGFGVGSGVLGGGGRG